MHLFSVFYRTSSPLEAAAQKNFIFHFPTQVNPAERERIQNAGGTVMIQRVNGSLAVSRALGDYEYKQVEGKGPCEQLVSPEPEVSIIDRDREGDQFVVLACDGIWDVMSNEELAEFVHSRMRLTNDLTQVCNQVCLWIEFMCPSVLLCIVPPGCPILCLFFCQHGQWRSLE